MALVVEHHEELEIDLLRQGVDLLDFWRGAIKPRRMQILMNGLPVESLTLASAQPKVAYVNAWGTTDYLLALLIDWYAAAHSENPKPIPRPADMWEQRIRDERIAELLTAQAERNRLRDREAKRV